MIGQYRDVRKRSGRGWGGSGVVLKLGFELGTPVLAQTDLEKSGHFSHAKSMQMLYLFQPI